MISHTQRFVSRGLGKEWDLPDFVSGEASKGMSDLKDNICAYVDNADGVADMFNGLVRISRGRIMVGVAPNNIKALEELHRLTRNNQGTITPEIIEQAKNAVFKAPKV